MLWVHAPAIVISSEDDAPRQGYGVVSSPAMVTSNG